MHVTVSPFSSRVSPIWLWLTVIGASGLALAAVTFWLTADRAPAVRVRWRDDVTAARQAELERRYMLANGQDPHPDSPRSVAYDLLDTSRRNVRALVQDPDVADTNDIDRELYVVSPDASPSSSRVWLANRLPGLREERTRRGLVIALAGSAVAGLARLLFAWLIAAGARRRVAGWLDLNHQVDPFDVLAARIDPEGRFTTQRTRPQSSQPLKQLLFAALALAAVGVPVLETWKTLFLAAILLAVIVGVCAPTWRRLGTAAALVAVIIGVKTVLPRADIAEAHNAFLVLGNGEPLERGLPPEVFRSWKSQFDDLYPPESAPYTPFSWRDRGPAVPVSAFAQSADALWRAPKYSRQVDTIEFRTLDEFRGGFTNDMLYNFWAGKPAREYLPFYVMYQLTDASVGSRLVWTGQVFWERSGGGFDEIVHRQPAARRIERADAGRRVYAAFFPERDRQMYFGLERSVKLRVGAWSDVLLTLIAGFLLTALTVRPRLAVYLRSATICGVGYLLAAWFAGGEYLGRSYPPHVGANDGLLHESHGRTMAMLAAAGDVVEAFKGIEPVYWFTPGMRYFRMVEKLVFGDTNHLYLLLVASLPLVIFYLVRQFAGLRWAWVATAAFVLMPVGNFSYLQNITNARFGYGEAAGGGLFLLGLALLLRAEPAWNGVRRGVSSIAVAGAALAASMFIRPNFALAVVWLGGAFAWASWRRRDIAAIITVASGLGFALWMPFHNWYYGSELYLISKPGSTISVPLAPADYGGAAADVLLGRADTETTRVVSSQLTGWLFGPGFIYSSAFAPVAWIAHVARLAALALTCAIALLWITGRLEKGNDLAVVAVAALCAHMPMLFIFSTYYRYAMLAWDLTLIVLLAWLARYALPVPRSHTDLVTV